MTVRFITEPWEAWPRAETHPIDRRSPFQASYGSTLELLGKELRHLETEQCIVQVKAKRSDIRADGLPRESLTALHPGVILTFDRKGSRVPITMPCDACRSWQDNLRAIVLTLERLRLAELYGVTNNGEQYRGWEALPPPGRQAEASMTLEKALDIVARLSGISQDLIKEDSTIREAAIRRARINAHPDRGGKAADALEVGQAAELLKQELGA